MMPHIDSPPVPPPLATPRKSQGAIVFRCQLRLIRQARRGDFQLVSTIDDLGAICGVQLLHNFPDVDLDGALTHL